MKKNGIYAVVGIVGLVFIFLSYSQKQENPVKTRNSPLLSSSQKYFEQGKQYMMQRKFKEAVNAFQNTLVLDSTNLLALCLKGEALAELGQYQQGISIWDSVIKMDEDNIPARVDKAAVLRKLGKEQESTDLLREALRTPVRNNYAWSYLMMGKGYYTLNDFDAAIENLDKAIHLDPQFANAYLLRGAAYFRQNHYDKALKDFNRTLIIEPEYADAYKARGMVYFTKDRYDLAIVDCNQAIRVNPKFVGAYVVRGISYGYQNQYPLAMQDFDAALRINRDYPEAYLGRGVVLQLENNFGAAKENYQMALNLNATGEVMDSATMNLHNIRENNGARFEGSEGVVSFLPFYEKPDIWQKVSLLSDYDSAVPGELKKTSDNGYPIFWEDSDMHLISDNPKVLFYGSMQQILVVKGDKYF